jgi:hypothetical protein
MITNFLYEYTNLLGKDHPDTTETPGVCLPTHTTISIFVQIRN